MGEGGRGRGRGVGRTTGEGKDAFSTVTGCRAGMETGLRRVI